MSVNNDKEKKLRNKIKSLKEKLSQETIKFIRKKIKNNIRSYVLELGQLRLPKNKNFEAQTVRNASYDPPLSNTFTKSKMTLFSLQERVTEKLHFLSTKFQNENETDDEEDDIHTINNL